MTLRERAFLGGRLFDAFRPAPAEPPAIEVEPVELPTSTENLTQEEIRAEALLVEQARRDPAAFGVLYERYVDRIYAYIYHRVGNMQEAEDLTARTFYRALDNLESYEDRGAPFAAWLFRIAQIFAVTAFYKLLNRTACSSYIP